MSVGTRKLIHGLVKHTQFFCELNRSLITKREISNAAKLSVIKSVFVPILTYYGHESWVTIESVLSQ